MTKGQIIPRLLRALTHVLCFYDSQWSLFVFRLWTVVPFSFLGNGGETLQSARITKVSTWGILCQDMMLDDKILLKCEGGGLGCEMPNGFPQLCYLNMVFISILRANRRLYCRFLPRNISPLCYPLPESVWNGILGGDCLESPILSTLPCAKGWC